MKTKNVFYFWGGLYILCLLLSFIPTTLSFLQPIFTLCGLGFFVPAYILLLRSFQQKDRALRLRLRLISGLSLLLTCIALFLNFLSITGSEALGNVMYVLLLLVSAPMAICGSWLLSLFLWAGLFVASFLKSR